MNEIRVWLDDKIGMWTIECSNGNCYECLSADEVPEVIKQEIENAN